MSRDSAYGVIFDMDGVLIDSYEPHRISWQDMAKEHGVEITDEQFAASFGRTSWEIIRSFWGDNLTDQQVRQMDDRKEEIFRDLIRRQFPAMPGAAEFIDDLLAKGFKVAIGSSGPPENVNLTIEKLGLDGKLSGVIHGQNVTRGKPDPQVFLLAAQKMGLTPDRCAVVEDAVHGVTAAKRAGMKAVALTGTSTRQALKDADLVVDRLAELNAGRIAALINGTPR